LAKLNSRGGWDITDEEAAEVIRSSEQHEDKPDRGTLRAYEISWYSKQAEIVWGHQVTFPGAFGSGIGSSSQKWFLIHGEFDGKWRLVLAGSMDYVRSIRDVTEAEEFMCRISQRSSDDDD
jgi:hypothetical protein